jgi:type 1 glutamine amidotransferase
MQFLRAQDTIRILHYTEATGFDHGTRMVSQLMFERICDSLSAQTPHVWILSHSDSSEVFDDLTALQQYKVIVWSNTSGAAGLTFAQRQNYELYVLGGGSYVGIHAASDTYRHSTANGSNTGAWDFYAGHLSGCSVQENPHHTAANHNNNMTHAATHSILSGIPDPWNKTEEYYYWENGFLDSSFTELLRVNATGTNTYDSVRMTAQYKQHAWGSRSFYTSLGHDVSNYTSDATFELLLKNALYWAADPVIQNVNESGAENIIVYPNPADEMVRLQFTTAGTERTIKIADVTGREIISVVSVQSVVEFSTALLPEGMYYYVVSADHSTLTSGKFVVTH